MTERKIKKKNFNFITILRGIATIGVTAFHMAPKRFSGGFLGVIMFFIMSGFLMMRNLDHSGLIDTRENLFAIVKKRLTKLLPPLYLIMVICLIFALFFAKAIYTDTIRSTLPVALGYQNIYQILAGGSYFQRNGNFSIFTHLWYIALQIQYILIFYSINFIIDKYIKRDIKVYVFAIISIISFALMYYFAISEASISRIYYGTDTRASALFIGAFFYLLSKYFEKFIIESNFELLNKGFILLTSLSVLPFFFVKGESYFTYKWFMIIYTLLVAILITYVYLLEKSYLFDKRKKSKIGIVGSILYYIGSRSYHIYLWQYMIQIAFSYTLSATIKNKFVFLIAEILLVLVLSELSFNLFKNKFKNNILIATLLFMLTGLVFASNFVKNEKAEDLKKLEETINKNKLQIEEDNKKALEAHRKKEKNIDKDSIQSSDNPNREEIKVNDQSSLDEKNIESLKDGDVKKDKYDFNFSSDEISYLNSLSVTAIGDSVLININSYLRTYIPNLYLDGEVGRNMIDAENILQKIKNENGLGDIILIALGSNGEMEADDMNQIMSIAENRQVFFVNTSHTQPWQDYINDQIKKFCDKTENAYLVDWYTYAKPKPELFAQDKVHPNVEGSTAYANIVAREILNANNKSSQ